MKEGENNIESICCHKETNKDGASSGKDTFVNITATKELVGILLENKIEKLDKAARYMKTNRKRSILTFPSDVPEAIAKRTIIYRCKNIKTRKLGNAKRD